MTDAGTTMLGEEKIQKNPRVVERELAHDRGGVLLHLGSGSYHGLNETAWTIWGLINGERTPAELLAEVRGRLEEASTQLEQDVAEFLDGLRERDLIR